MHRHGRPSKARIAGSADLRAFKLKPSPPPFSPRCFIRDVSSLHAPDLFPVGDGGSERVWVTPDGELDLTSFFACEGGKFDVLWSGIVNVPGTIYIGRGTTVRIIGSVAEGNSSLGESSSDSDQPRIAALSNKLPPLQNGLTAAVVSTLSDQSNASTASTSTTARDDGALDAQSGSIFFVDGGQLFLESLVVRGGNAINSTDASSGAVVVTGGGVHAVDANVTVTDCEFEDNFAQEMGGGIFTNRSTLVVVRSVFRRCQADAVSSPEDDVSGAGGGIGVRFTGTKASLINVSRDFSRQCIPL